MVHSPSISHGYSVCYLNGGKGSACFLNAFDKGVIAKGEDVNVIAIVVSNGGIDNEQVEVFKGWRHAIPFHRHNFNRVWVHASKKLVVLGRVEFDMTDHFNYIA